MCAVAFSSRKWPKKYGNSILEENGSKNKNNLTSLLLSQNIFLNSTHSQCFFQALPFQTFKTFLLGFPVSTQISPISLSDFSGRFIFCSSLPHKKAPFDLKKNSSFGNLPVPVFQILLRCLRLTLAPYRPPQDSSRGDETLFKVDKLEE